MRTIHKIMMTVVCVASSFTVQAQTPGALHVLSDNHAFYRLQQKHKFLLLPIEEKPTCASSKITKW